MTEPLAEVIQDHFMRLALSRAEQLESDCAGAMAGQAFDKLDRLIVVDRGGMDSPPPAVASWCGPRLTDGPDLPAYAPLWPESGVR